MEGQQKPGESFTSGRQRRVRSQEAQRIHPSRFIPEKLRRPVLKKPAYALCRSGWLLLFTEIKPAKTPSKLLRARQGTLAAQRGKRLSG
jgi:hypothetical protein